MALYDETPLDNFARFHNADCKVTSYGLKAQATWMLGYPDEAIKINEAKLTHAREHGQPIDVGWALTIGSRVLDFLREPEEQRRGAEEAERIDRENSIPLLGRSLTPIHSGIASIRLHKIAEGMTSLKVALTAYEGIGGKLTTPYYKSVLAEGMAEFGDVDGALRLLDEIIEQIERPGWEERWYYAEILRIKGGLLSLKGDTEGTESNYLASLDGARQQQAKSWELRTAMSYAQLMRDQGRTNEAYELLAPIYNWFTEGFGTKDLKDARALLDELQA